MAFLFGLGGGHPEGLESRLVPFDGGTFSESKFFFWNKQKQQ